MSLFDSFRRKKETGAKDVKTSSPPIPSYAPASAYSKQMPFRPATDQRQSGRLFQLSTKPAPVGRAVRLPNRIPAEGSEVFGKYSNVGLRLQKALMTDHISVTYATNRTDYFAKIYIADVLRLDMLENKAVSMLQRKVEIPGVCWPVDILTDGKKCFVGILVPASRGTQLTRSVFNGATGLSQYFPKWNKYDLCVLSMTILDKVCRMHDLGLLFGCINPASIYVADTSEVYFVDTDCWQIEGYPALSHNQTFTPPELLRDNNTQLLYSMDQENYQIAVMTFMLMMPGKFPYAKGRNADERNSIIDMAFPFSVGGGMRRSQDSERPSGIWRIVWDHLPYPMCDGFYNTFHSSGKYAQPGSRLKATVPLGVTGNGYLCGAVSVVKNIQVSILYTIYVCSKKKLTYGKEGIGYASPVLEINPTCLLNVNAVAANSIIQIEQRLCTKLAKAILISKSRDGVRTVKSERYDAEIVVKKYLFIR